MSDYDAKKEITLRAERIESIMDGMLPREEGYAEVVEKAMNYSIKVGGKRLRPMLLYECYRLFYDCGNKVQEEIVQYYMAAMECIHTYSLVHDDLPAMDNDMLRRGQPTTHAKFGEAMAILAGDALLNYAMELTTLAITMGADEDLRRLIQVQRLFFDRSGIYGMIGGQTADVLAERDGHDNSEKLLNYIHTNKTGALILASMLGGAMLGGADVYDQDTVASIATKIGLAFQIRDDILDIEGSEEVLGKPIGSDEKNEKLTYVSVFGMDKARADVDRLTAEAHELLDKLPGDKTFLHALFDELTSREK